jgi:hypothetical protein
MSYTVRGKRVLIKKPKKIESPIQLTEEMEKSLEKDLIKTWSKLEVAAVGEDVSGIKPGDKVYVGSALAHSEILEIDGEHYFMVNEQSIAVIW